MFKAARPQDRLKNSLKLARKSSNIISFHTKKHLFFSLAAEPHQVRKSCSKEASLLQNLHPAHQKTTKQTSHVPPPQVRQKAAIMEEF